VNIGATAVSRSARRVALVALTAILVGLGASGCAAGFNANTAKPYAPSNGSVASIGNLRIRNVVVVQSLDGGLSELYATVVSIGGGPDGYGTVAGTDVSPAPDTLTGISVAGASPVSIPGGSITIPPGAKIDLGPSGTHVFLDNFTVRRGEIASVTLTFATAGTVTLSALVMTATALVSGG
jgi:hypothetical protein